MLPNGDGQIRSTDGISLLTMLFATRAGFCSLGVFFVIAGLLLVIHVSQQMACRDSEVKCGEGLVRSLLRIGCSTKSF